MRKTLLAIAVGASTCAVPALAQVSPAPAGQAGISTGISTGQTQTGTSAGIGASTSSEIGADGTSKPALGLGSLIEDPMSAADQVETGAEPANGADKTLLDNQGGARGKSKSLPPGH